MDKASDVAVWSSEPQSHLSTDSEGSMFHNSYDTSPHSFIDATYSTAESTSSFVHSSATFSHPNSTKGSYDSHQPDSTTQSQLFEASAGPGSGMLTGSMLELRSSSMTSSLTGHGQDSSLADAHSRKASLGSSQDAHLASSLTHSPEFEDPGSVIGAVTAWPSTSSTVAQPTPTYDFRYGSASVAPDCVSTAPTYYPAEPQEQGVHPYAYASRGSMNLMASSLPINGLNATVSHFQSHIAAPSGRMAAGTTAGLGSLVDSTPSMLADSAGKGDTSTNSRASTSGSTRRAKFRRSRTGCMVCRKRKVKCDQDGQPCKQCRIGKRDCHYEDNPPKRKRKGKGEAESARKEKSQSSDAATEQPLLLGHQRNAEASTSVQQLGSSLLPAPHGRKSEDDVAPHDEQVMRAREAAEELKRTTDALFAQHTNFDQVDVEEEVGKSGGANGALQEAVDGQGRVDTFSLQYTNDDESADSMEPWATLSNQTGTLTGEDWTTTTPSTGPSSNKTVEGDSMTASYANLTNDGTPGSVALEDKSQMGSPFDKYLGLDEEGGVENVVTIETGGGLDRLPWYDTAAAPFGALASSAMEGGEVCLVGQEQV